MSLENIRKLRVRLKGIHKNFKLPIKGTIASAGFDLHLLEECNIEARGSKLIPLGFVIEIPENYYGLIVPRSSVGIKRGLSLKNTVGVIDSDYRGEVMVSIQNNNNYPVVLEAGERIAQLIISPIPAVELVEVDVLDSTERGSNGFGSTGMLEVIAPEQQNFKGSI